MADNQEHEERKAADLRAAMELDEALGLLQAHDEESAAIGCTTKTCGMKAGRSAVGRWKAGPSSSKRASPGPGCVGVARAPRTCCLCAPLCNRQGPL